MSKNLNETNSISYQEVMDSLAAARLTPFVSDDARKTCEEFAHLLPSEITHHRNPHVCDNWDGGEVCRCTFPFTRGAIYSFWSRDDNPKQVVRILGDIDNESGGGIWIVARILASDVPKACGQWSSSP